MKKLMVLIGPNGSGKTSITQGLANALHLPLITRHTTRSKSLNEINGVHYHFVDRRIFEKMTTEGKFVEYEEFPQGYYGTSKLAILDASNGAYSVMELNPSAIRSMKIFCENHRISFCTALVLPCKLDFFNKNPEGYLDILRKRIVIRGRSADLHSAEMSARIEAAKDIYKYLNLCDIIVENEDGRFENVISYLSSSVR